MLCRLPSWVCTFEIQMVTSSNVGYKMHNHLFCLFRCQFPQNKIHLHWFTHLSRASFGGVANNKGSSVDRSSTIFIFCLTSLLIQCINQPSDSTSFLFLIYHQSTETFSPWLHLHRGFCRLTLVIRNVKKPTPCWYTSRDWKHRTRVASCKVLFTRDEFMK